MVDISKIECFEWDDANVGKIIADHDVYPEEAEDVFFNEPKIIKESETTKKEIRHKILGLTDEGRYLLIVFTIRDNCIRVLSARDMNKDEYKNYEEKRKKF